MTVNDVYRILDKIAPFHTQLSFDNAGLLVGDSSQTVTSVGVVLDITPSVVEAAVKQGINLIISHHPVIFDPMRSVSADSVVALLLKNNISAISAHTNLDAAPGGVNDVLAKQLGLVDISPLGEDENDAVPMARIGKLPALSETKAFAEAVSETLHTCVKFAAVNKKIEKVVVCGGAGADFLSAAARAGADALVTADVKHHQFLSAQQLGVVLMDAGHFHTENPVIDALQKELKQQLSCPVVTLRQDSPVGFAYREGKN